MNCYKKKRWRKYFIISELVLLFSKKYCYMICYMFLFVF